MQFVRKRLDARQRSLSEIARGAGVGRRWLAMFARGEIPDPGYSKVKALFDYFAADDGRKSATARRKAPETSASADPS